MSALFRILFLSLASVLTFSAIIFWARNVWNCGYLQINSPSTFDNKGATYKVSKIVDKAGRLIPEKYQRE